MKLGIKRSLFMLETPTGFLIVFITTCLQHRVLCTTNDRPIVGIMAEETGKHFSKYGSSSITASYVKFLESSGARVVPIMIWKPQEYYEDLLRKINGVLFPGGANLWQSSGYGKTGRIIFDIATKMNQAGDSFPLWGTCLGFELLPFLVDGRSWMAACDAQDVPSTLSFTPESGDSRLLAGLDRQLWRLMENQRVAANYHRWCLTQQNFTLSGLDEYFKVLALSQDRKNLTYISIIEAREHPYYGVAFHPEKPAFEWADKPSHQNTPHSSDAIRAARYFADFFVQEARKSHHRFPNKTMEDAALIYNYVPVFTGKFNSDTIQYYFFP